jgi:hypothetical protein
MFVCMFACFFGGIEAGHLTLRGFCTTRPVNAMLAVSPR